MVRLGLNRLRDFNTLSLRAKITLGLGAVGVILLISSIISVMAYRSMSNYVSSLIAANIKSINMAQGLSEASNSYNLDMLAVIGDESLNSLPEFDQQSFMDQCDSLKLSLASVTRVPLTDSVLYAYSAYMLTSLELPEVIMSDFVDSRAWYFDRLQPRYDRLRNYISQMSDLIYSDLAKNSVTFERGFYRSIMPGIVAIGVGLLLLLMLLFFILSDYVNPIYKMLDGLSNYKACNKAYTYDFDGDDQLHELNEGISSLAAENQQLRKRLHQLRQSHGLHNVTNNNAER